MTDLDGIVTLTALHPDGCNAVLNLNVAGIPPELQQFWKDKFKEFQILLDLEKRMEK